MRDIFKSLYILKNLKVIFISIIFSIRHLTVGIRITSIRVIDNLPYRVEFTDENNTVPITVSKYYEQMWHLLKGKIK